MFYNAAPFLDSMFELKTMSDYKDRVSAKVILSKFLSNSGDWKSPISVKIKSEIKAMLTNKPVENIEVTK